MRIPIWISNRHIHLSQIDVEKLFEKGYQLQQDKPLSQPGKFSCKETLTLVWPKGKIEKVRIMWPTRKCTQVELLRGDIFVLWCEAPVRVSGNIQDSWSLTLVGPKWDVFISQGVIVAQRHLHCTIPEAKDLWVHHNQVVKIKIPGPRELVFDQVKVRVRDDAALDFHIDREEANAAGVEKWDWGEIVK